MDLKQMWKNRALQFWADIAPHFKYVAQSGLVSLLFLLFITSTYYYFKLLRHLPESFPMEWAAVAAFVPALSISPVRIFLKKADLLFLLPLETRMKRYFRAALSYSGIFQMAIVSCVLLIVWPLYLHTAAADTADSVLYYFLLLMLLKGVNLYGSWQELHFRDNMHRWGYGAIRWIANGVVVYALFEATFYRAAIFALLVMLTYTVALRLPLSYPIHWERLIEKEQQHRSRHYVFLSWFVDVPEEVPLRYKKRAYLTLWVKRLAFNRSSTYKALYFRSFFRSDLLGIVFRLLLLGTGMMLLFPQEIVKFVIYFFFLYLAIVQFAALGRFHRYLFWLHVYPLPSSTRVKSLVYVVYRLHLGFNALLFISLLITASAPFVYPVIALCLALGLSYLYCHKVLARKWGAEE